MKRIGSACGVLLAITLIGTAGCFAPTAKLPDLDDAEVQAEARVQARETAREYRRLVERLGAVAWKIAIANAGVCRGKEAHRAGYTPADAGMFEERWGKGMAGELGVHSASRPTVVTLVEGSPADEAGLEVGDVVLAVNGQDIEGSFWLGSWRERWEKAAPAGAEGAYTLRVRRGAGEHDVTVTPARVCGLGVGIDWKPEVNAWADGRSILVSQGMMAYADDVMLAFVIGHEMAHNTRRHIEADQNRVLAAHGLDLGFAVLAAALGTVHVPMNVQGARHAYSHEQELEADYVGVYHAARAGYDVGALEGLWRKMAEDHPAAANLPRFADSPGHGDTGREPAQRDRGGTGEDPARRSATAEREGGVSRCTRHRSTTTRRSRGWWGTTARNAKSPVCWVWRKARSPSGLPAGGV